ncbi:thioredoxin family protein [Patescibacteria group bacterium]|nr:thioredoxin family protein [Patescibacteria group bacterium]MBU1757826.1 thioredoxin family protein [Patescibacteria group bacterium]
MEDAEIIYEDEINISEEGTYDEIISGIENGDDESVVHINSNHNTNGHNDLISENDSEYLIFYGNGCPHCQKLMNYIKKNNLNANYDIDTLEIYFNYTNLDKLFAYLEKLGLETHTVGVPFLIINNDYECAYLNGYQAIIEFFDTKINERELPKLCEDESQTLLTGDETKRNVGLTQRLSFFGIMLPAALADSINPCAFAVILLLLSSILVKSDNRKKALWA